MKVTHYVHKLFFNGKVFFKGNGIYFAVKVYPCLYLLVALDYFM